MNGVASAADAAPGVGVAHRRPCGERDADDDDRDLEEVRRDHAPHAAHHVREEDDRADGEHGVGEVDTESGENAAGGHQLRGKDAEQARDVRQRRPQPDAATLAEAVREEIDWHDAAERAHALGREQAGQDQAQAAAEAVPHARPDAGRGADLSASEHHAGANLHSSKRGSGKGQPQIAAGDQVVRDALDPAAQHRAGDQRSQKVNDDDGNDHRGRIRGVHESANWNLALHVLAPAERR